MVSKNRLLSLSLLIALCALALAPEGTAQLRRLPGTGCPPAAWPMPSGQAQVGQLFTVTCPTCQPGNLSVIVMGTSGILLPLNPPLGCSAGCVLGCTPIVALMAPSVTLQIPNNPNLVGVCVCFQCGCFDTSLACFNLSGAFDACIVP